MVDSDEAKEMYCPMKASKPDDHQTIDVTCDASLCMAWRTEKQTEVQHVSANDHRAISALELEGWKRLPSPFPPSITLGYGQVSFTREVKHESPVGYCGLAGRPNS